MSKISNVITMLELLQSGTPRMIRCYKEELEKSGIYIDSIKGIYGGYVLNNSIRIPARKFKKIDYKILDEYINNETDIKKKDELVLLQDKIRGIYMGSNTIRHRVKGGFHYG